MQCLNCKLQSLRFDKKDRDVDNKWESQHYSICDKDQFEPKFPRCFQVQKIIIKKSRELKKLPYSSQ